MVTLDRVQDNPNICAVEVGFSGQLTAANIPDWQEFYNSMMVEVDFTKVYVGLGSVSFGEESQESAAGTSYKQSVSIRFPATDKNRSERIALMANAKFIKLKLTNGSDIVIGRNDYKQNARPRIKIKTNVKLAEVEFETVSMFPSGFSSSLLIFGLPLIPVNIS